MFYTAEEFEAQVNDLIERGISEQEARLLVTAADAADARAYERWSEQLHAEEQYLSALESL